MSKVSIICATYLKENDRYLKLAIESIKNQSYTNYELIVVSSGSHIPELPDWVKQLHHTDQHHYPEAINSGVKLADPQSKYYLIINDDVILTKNALKNMVEVAQDNDIILNPISNCDNYAKYNLMFGYFKGYKTSDFTPLPKRFYRYDDLYGQFEHMMNAESIYPPGIIAQDFVAFYATLFPKKTWDKLGGLDPEFKTGADDVDCSYRAKALKIPCAFALNALIWHFGGTTADIALTPEIRRTNIEYFTKKWGQLPP